MEMSRDVWKSSPNVIAHIEMEAKNHQLEDELRRRKVEQLKVSLFLINLIFSVSKLVLIRILLIPFGENFPWNETVHVFFSMRWDECSVCHSIWKFSSGKHCSISFLTRRTVYFIKMHGCSDFLNIPVKARKAGRTPLEVHFFCPKNVLWKILFDLLFPFEKPFFPYKW